MVITAVTSRLSKAEARPSANLVVLGCLEHFNLYSLFLSDDLNFCDSTFVLIT